MLLHIHIFIYVPIIHVHVLFPKLCHLLLISIVLIIYAFVSCVPSMFHHIHFGMSIIYSYHIRCIYIYFFIYFSFTFMFMSMFMFIFQFFFMFHIIFMFHEHIYTYCIFYIFLVSCLLHMALHILVKYDVYEITPHSYILIHL